MRSSGSVDSPRGFGDHGRVCWPYADVDDLLSGVATYLSDGSARGDHAARSGAPAVVVHHPPPSVAIVLDALGMPRMRVGASR